MGNGLSNDKLDQEYISDIRTLAYQAATELIGQSRMKEGSLLVVGCSTSEVAGERIGSYSNPELGQAIFDGIYHATIENHIYLVAQCCEHLNRALIMEAEAADMYGYEQVNVVPQPKAGGSFATAAYHSFQNPVAVEHVKAAAGMDIGDTLIGMHLKDVAVPVGISVRQIGDARLICARTRPKFTGGARAVYDEELL